jgi:hypothetical protein
VNNVQNDVCGTGNGSVTASAAGGNPPLMYLWSNGDTLPTSSGLTAGTYQLTVTDQSGCQVSTPPVTLTSNGGPFGLSVVQISDVACYGDSTGTIVVQAVNGTAPYVYAWSNGSLSPVQTQLPAGNYTLTLVDASGCVTVEAFDVDQPAAALQTGWQSDSLANGWSVTLLPQGGTPPYDALWDAATGNQTGLTASGLASGAYSVTLTDAQGCTEVVSGIVAGTNRADGPEESLHMVLYPNPAWGDAFLTLSGWNPMALQVKVTDSSGRCLYDETLQVQGSNVSLTVPSASWPDGWYWVRVMDPETGQWAVRTLVRNRQ